MFHAQHAPRTHAYDPRMTLPPLQTLSLAASYAQPLSPRAHYASPSSYASPTSPYAQYPSPVSPPPFVVPDAPGSRMRSASDAARQRRNSIRRSAPTPTSPQARPRSSDGLPSPPPSGGFASFRLPEPPSDGESASEGEDDDSNGARAPARRRRPEERRHQCAECAKRFSRPSSLRIHAHTHTGSKRTSALPCSARDVLTCPPAFECPHTGCGRTFSVNSNMRRHFRTHGGDSGEHPPSAFPPAVRRRSGSGSSSG
jgi:uncharacterized Zn-finger protein